MEEPESDANTVGGWVVEKFEEIPKRGDTFDYQNLTIRVNETGSRRVESIRVKVHPHEAAGNREE